MAVALTLMLADLRAKYEERPSTPAFDRLYPSNDPLSHMFSVLHKELNGHFENINDRARSTRHYWAEPSREMIALIDEVHADLYALRRGGIDVELAPPYQEAIERCQPWLSPSGGSTVPDDFDAIDVLRYEDVFTRLNATVRVAKDPEPQVLIMKGEGSHAHVYWYTDPTYDRKVAVKRAKPGISERDLTRFKREFEVMKDLSFPYVVEVYRYDDDRNEYRMEFCDETLREYIARRNNVLTFATRKRIALQFLYGLNYIHTQRLLHRDISLQNVLLKVYDGGAVLVKLSDFGLAKELDSNFTRTQTELRGTIVDPQLDSLVAYEITHELYAVGFVLSFVFSGRERLMQDAGALGRVVLKCTHHDTGERYANVLELISDVEALVVTPTDASA